MSCNLSASDPPGGPALDGHPAQECAQRSDRPTAYPRSGNRRTLPADRCRSHNGIRLAGQTGRRRCCRRRARAEARWLAAAVITLGAELEGNQRALAKHAELMASGVLDVRGVGPVAAAIILAASSHHGRVRSEAAFAALAGASPIPPSSGNTTRRQLNRYGDRQLNRALDVVARTKSLADLAARAHIGRRTAEGRSLREVCHCPKRLIARQISANSRHSWLGLSP